MTAPHSAAARPAPPGFSRGGRGAGAAATGGASRRAAGAPGAGREAAPSPTPSSPDASTAITAPTVALCPSGILISRSTPLSDASSSTSALSVSTSAKGSPLATGSPGAFIQRMMTPDSMVSLSFGMRTSIDMAAV
ncbi:hypothetical protein KF840_24900 [bacterium]|nr:hypothetical protein [bacterium]